MENGAVPGPRNMKTREAMLDDRQKDALRRWYAQPKVLDEARRRIKDKYWEDLEEFLHMRALFPLGRTDELPDYLKTEDGKPLLPSVDPRNNQEAWQDAIEIGWEVVEAELGVSRDEVHRAIGQQQRDTWDEFMKSIERRKRERGE
jgi:hypothetical protein